ncbi:hypothetical protein [Bacillus sp. AFS017336]|uniref:hypothetical protein n=1 Tax=Bacillus sp. AFS017336 TaxID=2033489 RepID=UPI000BF016DF|nr:hypothetical protein [Bacillus sp. AFS017336]PEL07611.1 hypothetical protein CN601_19390 [Bacillus sp. AFS017336]
MKTYLSMTGKIYKLFYILTGLMLVFSIVILSSASFLNATRTYLKWFAIIYLVILLITLVTIALNILVASSFLVKNVWLLKLLIKKVLPFFMIGVVITISLSLVKYKTVFSVKFVDILIAFTTIIPLLWFSFKKAEK